MESPAKSPVKLKLVPEADKTTMLATATQVESNCGLFVLSLVELRPVKVHEPDERFKNDASAFVEIGRFALSPIALVNLKNQIAAAEATHARSFGPIPDPTTFAQNCADNITDDYRRSLQPRPMGLRLPNDTRQPEPVSAKLAD